jgi:hypothetical protein
MRLSRLVIIGCVLLFAPAAVPAQTVSASLEPRKIDEFGVVNCEYEMAKLDNFLVELQNGPPATAYVIYYGGRRYGKKLPLFGEAAARAARLAKYLTEQRGLSPERLVIKDGGFREFWTVELWGVPVGATPPAPTPTLQRRDIKYRKGKPTAGMRCGM